MDSIDEVLTFLDMHHKAFFAGRKYADATAQPTPEDSRAYSQILVSMLTGIPGLGRKKGSDFLDGSDVKAANTWGAIDTPRFNGCIKAGTKSSVSDSMQSLDTMPYLFFVLWDYEPCSRRERTRIWCVRTQVDTLFRSICKKWYSQRARGEILSSNFQLHPPRNQNSDKFNNTCGNLNYPLFFEAIYNGREYEVTHYAPEVMQSGSCTPAN